MRHGRRGPRSTRTGRWRALALWTLNGRRKARIIETNDMEGSSTTRGNGRKTAMTAPTLGTKLSQKASTPKASHRSRPMASRTRAVKEPTRSESQTLPLMYARIWSSASFGLGAGSVAA